MLVPVSARIAAVLLWVSALGLGIPCLMAIRNLLMGRGIPLVLGFPPTGEALSNGTVFRPRSHSFPAFCSSACSRLLQAGCCGPDFVVVRSWPCSSCSRVGCIGGDSHCRTHPFSPCCERSSSS